MSPVARLAELLLPKVPPTTRGPVTVARHLLQARALAAACG
jgi:hypothetical protein